MRSRLEFGAALGYLTVMNAELDVRGLACPLPVLKAKKRLRSMAPGEVLVVHATDPGSVGDFRAFADLTGHRLLASTETDGVFTFELQRN